MNNQSNVEMETDGRKRQPPPPGSGPAMSSKVLEFSAANIATSVDKAEAAELLAVVVAHFSESVQDAPGHVHTVKGRWDRDGSICYWCATWNRIREVVARMNP